jgi:hypothetical protein
METARSEQNIQANGNKLAVDVVEEPIEGLAVGDPSWER